MGILRWLLKNGFGSPGSTAKTISKQYKTIQKTNIQGEWKEIFSEIILYRNLASKMARVIKGNLLLEIEPSEIIQFSRGDLSLLTFQIMFLENSGFRNKIFSDFNVFMLSSEIIYETVSERTPNCVKFSLFEIRMLMIQFAQICEAKYYERLFLNQNKETWSFQYMTIQEQIHQF